MSEKNKKEKRVYTDIEKCKRKVWTLRTAGLAIIFAFFALVAYEASINLEGLPTAVFYKNTLINDSFIAFVGLGVISLILTITGLILSLTRRSLTGFFLSLIIPFTIIAFRGHIPVVDMTDFSTSIEIKSRNYVAPVIDVNTTETTVETNTTI